MAGLKESLIDIKNVIRESKSIARVAVTIAITTAIGYLSDPTRAQIFVHHFFPHATLGQALVSVYLLTTVASSLHSLLPKSKEI